MGSAPAGGASPGGRIYYGWWMVVVTSVMSFFASGFSFADLACWYSRFATQLGITQAQTNLVFSIARAEGGLEGPLAGWLIDKFGNRKVLVPSLIITVVGYFIMAFWLPGSGGSPSSTWGWYRWATAWGFNTPASPA